MGHYMHSLRPGEEVENFQLLRRVVANGKDGVIYLLRMPSYAFARTVNQPLSGFIAKKWFVLLRGNAY